MLKTLESAGDLLKGQFEERELEELRSTVEEI